MSPAGDDAAEAAAARVRRAGPSHIGTLLRDREADWLSRDAARQRTAELARNNALDAASEHFRPILIGLSKQLADLRSQVVRSACFALTEIAAAAGDHQACDRPMREAIVPELLKLAGNGNKVLAGAGRDCLPTLVEHCHFAGMLHVLVGTLKESKQAAVRRLCCVCLLSALQQWPMEVLTPVGAHVHTVGTTGCGGAGLGQLNGPRGAAVDFERVYVVDAGNHRVQVFLQPVRRR